MAINYTTVATHLGKIVGKTNSYATIATTTLPADVAAIVVAFGTGSTTFGSAQAPIQGITDKYAKFQNQITEWATALMQFATKTLTDTDTITSQLVGLPQTDLVSILKAIMQDMVDNSQSVKFNSVTLGTVTALSGNTGNGTALVDKVLDGYNPPLAGGIASLTYNGLNSQLGVPSETMELICTTDSFTGGVQEGSEQWQWIGGQKYVPFDYHSEGSGAGPNITTANADTTIQNLGFDSFSSNTPTNWTIAAGAAGTDIFQETTTTFRGGSALKFTGTGSAQPSITQSMTVQQLKSRRRYLFTIQARKGGAAAGTEKLTILFTGTGYTASSSEKINISVSSLTTSFATQSFYINLPVTIPSDFKISISITNANLTSGTFVYLDSGSFKPVDYHGGVSAQVIAGSTPWVVGDRLTFTVANTTSGKFQNYMRRAFGIQLPSKSDGSETIDDALAA